MDLKKLCRTCLKETNDNMVPIFITVTELAIETTFQDIYLNTKDLSLPSGLTVATMITECSLNESAGADFLPKQICMYCLKCLYIAYTFRKNCENALKKFKNLLCGDEASGNLKLIKQHPDTTLHEKPSSFSKSEKYIQTDDSCIKPCEFCDMKFFNSQKLKEHRLIHKDEGIKCRICAKEYTKLTDLQRHIITAHSKEFNLSSSQFLHTCLVCDKQFTRIENLKLHSQKMHAKESEAKTAHSDEECDAHSEIYGDTIDVNNDSDTNCSNRTEDSKIDINLLNQTENSDNRIIEETLILDDNFEPMDALFTDKNDDFEVKQEPLVTEPIELNNSVEDTLKPLVKIVGLKIRNYKCGTCLKDFRSSSDFNKHKTEHKNPPKSSKAQHQCFDCKKIFSRPSHLKRHMPIHSKERPYNCDICGKGFNRADQLQIHQYVHTNTKLFSCGYCDQSFERIDGLGNHIKSCLPIKPRKASDKNFTCEICLKSFQCSTYLKRHSLVHSRKSFDCKTCGKQYQNSKELNEHTKTHATERPYLCSECGLRFVRHDYLVVHMRRHKGEKPYKCRYCEKGFPRATDLTVHERYHTGEKTHLCTTCGKGFQRAYNLLVHTRIHTGERPYKCPHCTKSFAQGNDLKAHVRRHTGERYKCDICGDGFIQGYHLTQHKRNKHGIDTKSQITRLKKFLPTADGEPIPVPAVAKLSVDIKNTRARNNKQEKSSHSVNKIIKIDDNSHSSISCSTQQTQSPFQIIEQQNIKIEPRINISCSESQSPNIASCQDHQYHYPTILSSQNVNYQPPTQYQSQTRQHQQSIHSIVTTQYISARPPQPILTNAVDFPLASTKTRDQAK